MQTEELPPEYVSIRSIWLKQINRCNEAFSKMAFPDASTGSLDYDVGYRTAVYSVDALYNSLVDYGEALVRSDVEKWYNENYKPKYNEIWHQNSTVRNAWNRSSKISMSLFQYIIKILNKYGMLFPQQPMGYSNVEMKSV
jgi:hypothetical protein